MSLYMTALDAALNEGTCVTAPSQAADALRDAADPAARAEARPLCVDLDGSLILSDTLHESLIKAFAREPAATLRTLMNDLEDRARLKASLAALATPDPALLPYREDLLEALRAERAAGRRLVLATAADQSIADGVAAELGIFEAALGTRDGVNLKGERKAAALAERFGEGGFDYVGDSPSDAPVWRRGGGGWVAGPRLSLARASRASGVELSRAFGASPQGLPERIGAQALLWARALRLYQWVKNVLVFIPGIAAGTLLQPEVFWPLLAMFLLFGLCASGTYIVNDLLDLETDRRHPRKRRRAFASGRISVLSGVLVSGALILGALVGAALIGLPALAVLAIYLATTLLYSFALKKAPIYDVFALAGLYCLRIVAGGVAAGIPLSIWLLSFCGALFLSLACLKRVGELVGQDAAAKSLGRGYRAGDETMIAALGVSVGVASCVLFCLYAGSPQAALVYSAPIYLLGAAPFLLLWVARLWLLTWRGKGEDDPIVTVATDPASWAMLLGCFAFLLAAHFGEAGPSAHW